MADITTKTYLDLDGLKKYDAKIKTYLETRDGDLTTLTTDAKDNLVSMFRRKIGSNRRRSGIETL